MPNISDDKRALDFVLAKPDDPRSFKVMETLGIGVDDVKALNIAKTREQKDPEDPIVKKIKNKIFTKIAINRPVEETREGLPLGDRLVIKNLIDKEPQLQRKYLDKKGYTTRIQDGELQFKKPEDVNFKRVDPEGLDWFDIFDVMGDVTEAVATGIATSSKALGTAVSPITGGSTIAAGSIIGGGVMGAYETLKQSIAKALGARDEFDPTEIGKQTAVGALIPGATGIASKGFKLVSKGLGSFQRLTGSRLKDAAPEIQEAAAVIGAKPTAGQLFSNPTIQKLESAQAQSGGMIGGIGIRKQIEQNKLISASTAKTIVKDASSKSQYEIGDQLGQQLTDELTKKLAPAEAIYNKYQSKFRMIPIKKGDFDNIKNELKEISKEFKFDKKGKKFIKEVTDQLNSVRTLDEVKDFRRYLSNEISRNPTDKGILRVGAKIYPQVTKVRSNVLLRRSKEEGEDFYKVAIDEITNADKIYSKSIRELENVIKNPGKKIVLTPKKELQKFLEETPAIDRINKILKTRDPKKIEGVKKAFPEVFESLRTAKIQEIFDASGGSAKLNPLQLAKKVDALPEETAILLFGSDATKKAKALKIFLQSVPENLNPSGSATAFELLNYKFLFDNLQSLRRTFSLDLRTKSIMENDIFKKMSDWLVNSRIPVTTGVLGVKALPEESKPSLINEQAIPPQRLIPRR